MTEKTGKSLRIRWIRQTGKDGKSRITCGIEESTIVGNNPSIVDKEVFFEVPAEYSMYLVAERSDAFVVLLLRYALSGGYDIVSDVAMSEDLYFNITERLLPPMVKNGGYDVKIKANLLPPLPKGMGVGADMNCDVDSFHIVGKYRGYPIKRYRLTHLSVNDLGSFEEMHSVDPSEDVKAAAYDRARKAAEQIGIPLIETDSNVVSVFPQNYSQSHDFTSVFAVLCLKKLWRCYHYVSRVGNFSGWSLDRFLGKDSSEYGTFLLSCLSTPSLELIPESGTVSMIDKVSGIAFDPVAQAHLYSCTHSKENCSRCDGCARSLLALDCLGKLDSFSGTYDIGFYKKHRSHYYWHLRENKDKDEYAPMYEALRHKNGPKFRAVEKVAVLIERFDVLWSKNSQVADEKAVGLVMPYKLVDARATSRLASAYRSGRGVKKSKEEAMACYHYVADFYRKEVEDGFADSGVKLFDTLWDMGGSDDELMVAILPEVNVQNPHAMARMSKMFSEGRGVEKDHEMACMWMRNAAESDPAEYASDYCRMMMDSKDPELRAEAVEFCKGQLSKDDSPELCAMLSRMYSSGKDLDQNYPEAVRLMEIAVSKDPGYEMEYCRLLMRSDDESDRRKAARTCSKLCKTNGGADSWILMSELYRDGIGVPQDIGESVKWMRKALGERPVQLSYEFCRLLQSSGDSKLEKEAFERAESRYAKTGSDMYMAIMARAYRDGKGVEKDIPKAVECMKKAADSAPSKYLREYCELLASSDRPEDNKEAHRICAGIYHKSGSPFSCLMLANMYRDGKGVKKNVSKALDFLDSYSAATGGMSNSAYCEFIIDSDDPELHQKAWRLCNEYYSDTYEPIYCGLMARMYRDGKGVEKDLNKAAEWMEKAYIDDPDKWSDEFNEIILKIE